MQFKNAEEEPLTNAPILSWYVRQEQQSESLAWQLYRLFYNHKINPPRFNNCREHKVRSGMYAQFSWLRSIASGTVENIQCSFYVPKSLYFNAGKNFRNNFAISCLRYTFAISNEK